MKHFYVFSLLKSKGRKAFRSLTLGLSLLLGILNVVNAQVSTYTFSQSNGTFVPITGTVLGTATANTSAANLNSNVYPLTLPFSFVFNGTSYSSLNVSTNGFLSFGATAPGTTVTSPISSTTNTAYDGAVSVFGRDLTSFFDINGTTGSISWETIGNAPNREVVIQWRNFRPNNSTSTTSVYALSFQVRLHETSNIIDMVYDAGVALVGTTTLTGTAQIGLRGSSNVDFNNRLNSTSLAFIDSTAGTANSSTQNFNTTNATPGMPSAGLTYTWTPPSCWITNGLTIVSSDSDSADISWMASASSPGSYDIYYSTSSTPPMSSTPPTMPNVSGTTATLSPLAPATTYFVWVRANCGSGSTSAWSSKIVLVSTLCQPPAVLSTSGETVCPGQAASLFATADAGVLYTWYDDATAGNVVGTASTFVTPAIMTTTNYWVSVKTQNSGNIGKTTPESSSGNSGFNDIGLVFDAQSNFTLQSVDVYPMHASNTAGTVTISLKNSAGTVLESTTANVNISPGGLLNTVALNFVIPQGNGYRLVITGTSNISNIKRESVASQFSYPYILPGVCSITSAYTSGISGAYYYYFYNWQVASVCESTRTMVTATADAAACLSTSEVNGKDNIKVYPNPFSELINISQPELVKSIQVSDVSGKLIKMINKPESVIRLQDLLQGMYILQLEMKDGSRQSVKVIKK